MGSMWISAYLWMLVLVLIWVFLVAWRWKKVRSMSSDLPPVIHVAVEPLPGFAYVEGEEGDRAKCRGEVECSICLGMFLKGETLRLMPSCCHVFHAECVDRWLTCSPTCPCCRSNLLPPSATQPDPFPDV